MEAEDAVSTNFAREPTLIFDASGLRALQLNRSTGVEGLGSFYADFVFTVPSAGTWELWYGGTPPGPRDEASPSYASPFQYTVDAQPPVAVFQESDTIIGSYSPGYYWNRVGDVTLDGQRHTLRFEITQKRRADARYFFYLDCFFLVRMEGGQRVVSAPLPAVFPSDLGAAGIPAPFLSIDDALIKVRDAPDKTQPLVDLALSYTMLGDYLNALKYLNKAAVLDPLSAEITLLIAKNRIWKGDTADGLRAYRDLLQRNPRQLTLWLEAGKVAAWAGRFDESISFLHDGLVQFPGNTDLAVNLGLTEVWAGRGQDAEIVFKDAEARAANNAAKLKDIARAYRVNGYPDRALKTYEAAIKADPRDLESYMLIAQTLQGLGRTADAADTLRRVSDTFAPSDRLSTFLEAFTDREGMKNQVMTQYRDSLAKNPDNLVLRQLLAQTYFWNGMKANAVAEYRNIIDNDAYISVRAMEHSTEALLGSIDAGALLRDWLTRAPGLAQKKRAALSAQQQKAAQAAAARDAAAKTLDKATAAQAAAKPGKDVDAAASAQAAAHDALAAAEAAAAREAAALASRAADAAALSERLADVSARVAAVEKTLADQLPLDTAAEQELSRAVKGTGWRFDRNGLLADLARDAADSPLARLLSARISLMDGQSASVESALAPLRIEGSVDAKLVLARSRLAAGKVADAAPLLQDLAAAPAADVPSYVGDLAALSAQLAAEPAAAPAPDAATADATTVDTAAAVAQAAQAARDLAGFESAVSASLGRLSNALAGLRTLYRHGIIRAFHSFDEQVVSLRNDLGDYYLAGNPPQLPEAIAQFTKVLAVSPGDLSATFRLGKVYQWQGDWKAALDSYALVYAADPGYENVASLYNDVERAHADTVAALSSYFEEPQRALWHAEASYSLPVSSTAGIALGYQTDAVRIQRPVNGVEQASSYQVHDVSVGTPLSLFGGAFTLTPALGGTLEANGLYQATDASGALTGTDLFGVAAAEPYVRVDTSLSVPNTLYLAATARYGRQWETWDPMRTPVYDASAEANLNTFLSFIDAWPLHDTSLRTYGKFEYLYRAGFAYENVLVTALQEIAVNVLKGGDPYGVLTLVGNVTYQHSDQVGATDYYAPPDVFMAGANLVGSTWIGTGGGDVLGLSARIYGGSYLEEAFTAAEIPRIKGEAETDVSLTRGNGTYSLAVVANATYNLALAAALADPWDYWSVYVRLGYTAKLPKLRAP